MDNFPELEFASKQADESNDLKTYDAANSIAIEETPTKKNNSLTIESLNEEEQKLIRDFVKKIEITNSTAILEYGAPAQTKIANFSDSVLKNVKTKDLNEAGELLSGLVVEIRNFDNDTGPSKNPIKDFFSKSKKKYDVMTSRFNTIEKNIGTITTSLEGHKHSLLKDIAMYDNMFENNYTYFKEISYYIIAGKEKLKELNNEILPEFKKVAEDSNDQMDVQKYNDMVNLTNNFEKKINDLQMSRMVSIQMAPQIRLIQNNDSQLVEKIQSSLVNAIPLWKNQIIIALGLANTQKALKAQQEVSKMTNELLIKNSEMLKIGTIEVARESEKTIISIEAIRESNANLITTINEVIDIQKNGRVQRLAAEQELIQIEIDLKKSLFSSQLEQRAIQNTQE